MQPISCKGPQMKNGFRVCVTCITVVLSHGVFKACAEGTARCATFTCPLHNMTDSAKIYVRSRLWNSTMLEVSSPATATYTHTHTHTHTHTLMMIQLNTPQLLPAPIQAKNSSDYKHISYHIRILCADPFLLSRCALP